MIRQTVFPFKLEITNEILTARSGLALMAEFNHGIGLKELSDRHLPSPESNRGYKPSAYVDSLVLMLEGGGGNLEDIRELQSEEGLMRLIDRKIIPSPDAIGDWLRRMGDKKTDQGGLKGLDKIREVINHRILRRDGIDGYTLDADAMEIVAEKEEACFTYKGNKGYMPMLGFLCEAKVLIYDEFREGNTSPSFGQVGFYKECKRRMPEGKRIARYRADSASYQAVLINELETDWVKFTITADMDSAMKGLIAGIPEEEWKEPLKGCGYKLAEAIHSMNKTEKAFRVVIKREFLRQKEMFKDTQDYFHYYVVATNFSEEEKDAGEAMKWHNGRGDQENFNKELKHGIGMDYMPCGTIGANSVFFRLGVIAYNLFIGFKRLTCPEGWVRHTIGTFRWRLLQIAGRIVRRSGAVILKIA